MAAQRSPLTRRILVTVRYVVPAAVVLTGVILFAIKPTVDRADGAAALIGAGLSILLLNFLYRMGVSGDHDRDDERDARRFFDTHGYWPDEQSAPPSTKDD